jgi:hypothetical protein
MRFPLFWHALYLLCLAPFSLGAQRISQLEPGTLLRIATRSGAQIIGPLAEVRADTVFLSSTVHSKEAAVPMMSVERYEYADGTEPGHGALGAIIGGAVGASLAMLMGGGGDGDSDGGMFLSGGFLRGTVVVLGTVLGYAAGSSNSAPHWVLPVRSQSRSMQPVATQPLVRLAVRF